MNDKELLELAAKAAGIKHHGKFSGVDGGLYVEDEYVDEVYTITWYPITDDGDALRLAVKLHIDIRHFMYEQGLMDCLVDRIGKGFSEVIEDDPYAATRRAIVRAAAEIGKEIK